jgi:exopolyphosphatase/guanosine-5'-triphosphate,3'-diphosphate pyrophosphatase
MQIGAIDIGTNSIHMVIVRVDQGGSYEVVDREKEMVRLGRGSLAAGALTEEAMEAGYACLNRLRKLARAHGCDYLVASATSVVRDSSNRQEFLSNVEERFGIHVRLLSGREEAELIFRGVREEMDLSEKKVLVVDIGGGSTEFIVGNSCGAHLAESLPLGIIRMTDAFATNPGVTPKKNYQALTKKVRELAGPVLESARAMGFDHLIGTSGTFKSLGELLRTRSSIPGDWTRLAGFHQAELEGFTEQLQGLSEGERREIKRMNPMRASNIAVGATIVAELLRLAKVEEVRLSNRALRDGLILEAIDSLPDLKRRERRGRDLRRRSILGLARKHPFSLKHGEHTARLALQLFDQTGGLHGLGPPERELLEYASILHDVGVDVAYTRHHKHSYYLITNAELPGFDPEEIREIALIARYHRKSLPGPDHDEFRSLKDSRRQAVSSLAALLRLADAMDRTHRGVVKRVRLHHSPGKVLVQLEGQKDTELEQGAIERKKDLFEQLWDRHIQIEEVTLTSPVSNSPSSLLELCKVKK